MTGRKTARTIAAATVGNALEFFDFTVFTAYAAYIGDYFFGSTDDYVRVLQAVSVFGLGFVARPLGALLIGYYADTRGRKAAMTLTLLSMCVGSLLIAILPGYKAIGIAAPVLLLVARLLQGFSVGGEMGPATAFLVESAPDTKTSRRAASWQLASQSFATIASGLLGALLSLVLTHHELASWGWRIPFAIGAMIGPIGLWLRGALEETLVPEPGQQKTPHILSVFTGMPVEVLSGMLITAGGTVLQYFFLYCALFAEKNLHFHALPALSVNIAIGAGTAFGAIASGYLVSTFGQTAIVVTCRVILACTIVPVFMLFSHGAGFPVVFSLLGFLAIFHGAASGTGTGILTRLFPMPVRTVGVGCAYSLAVTVFGGSAQPIFTVIINRTGSSVSWCFYVVVMALLSTVPFLWMRKRLRDRPVSLATGLNTP
ncbi:MFS transporter [Gluconobacter sp. LMG 1744]|uniref:MFS transporter n=1 Tax=Gluconobacter cadivus TaxID=2728101 RepID=UPI001884E849|nr:MFS transporter [Gluconobacter cadivus]MBF0892020.1 MFS transporter [Gluconobacter cadivus]